ncbi:unnamed protein product [Dovyalis caffra]|uniref:Uncharacterized protein n=1 Tax=Dovyalis caffra TaxID=77055 RepID=A0AAV1SDC4_9ROSI|nr:unnamed protein product [Dovyalis caffra]
MSFGESLPPSREVFLGLRGEVNVKNPIDAIDATSRETYDASANGDRRFEEMPSLEALEIFARRPFEASNPLVNVSNVPLLCDPPRPLVVDQSIPLMVMIDHPEMINVQDIGLHHRLDERVNEDEVVSVHILDVEHEQFKEASTRSDLALNQ